MGEAEQHSYRLCTEDLGKRAGAAFGAYLVCDQRQSGQIQVCGDDDVRVSIEDRIDELLGRGHLDVLSRATLTHDRPKSTLLHMVLPVRSHMFSNTNLQDLLVY